MNYYLLPKNMVTCFHSSGSLAAPDILFVDMIYKIDYCIKGQPKRKSHMYTRAATDEDALKAFCISLLRTNWHQAKLLKQAVGHIAERDAWEESLIP